MKANKTPVQQLAGNADEAMDLAIEIDAIRKADPTRHARIMRKLTEIEARRRK